MSVTFGFYNSKNGDRKYDAAQMSSIFDGIIRDGILQHFGTAMEVTASGENMIVNVGIGRAWFNHTWTLNDSILPLIIDASEMLLDRIDAVVLEVNTREEIRANSIKIVKGVPSSNPSRPTMIKTNDQWQYPLAYIQVDKGITSIRQANITNCIGTSECPYVTAPLEMMSIDNLIAQWKDEWSEYFGNKKTEFNQWFSGLRDILSGDVATSLSDRMLSLEKHAILDSFISPEQHRMIFRGKNLGSSFTSAQKTQVQNGTFDDIYLGDYWKIGSFTYRIVDIDYWYRCGSTELTKHHLVIMPDETMYEGKMGEYDERTNNGYLYSVMFKSGLNDAKSIIDDAFGNDSVITRREYFVNKAVEGVPSGSAATYVTLEIPSERMIYGSEIMATKGNQSSSYTYSKSQLALFSVSPKFIIAKGIDASRHSYWLRDIVSLFNFAYVNLSGEADNTILSIDSGVRPVFAIG